MSSSLAQASFNKSLDNQRNNSLATEKYFLRINKGFDKGAVFQLKSREILIGRDPANHIQLKNDPKVSRQHVRLVLSNGKYVIQDITKNNFITINGIKAKQTELKHNQVIQIGEHSLQFIVSTNVPSAPMSRSQGASAPMNPMRIILLAVILLGGMAYFFMSPPKITAVPKIENLESKTIVDKRIESLEDSITKLDEAIKNSNKTDPTGKSAQSLYIQGKRDFDRGQYSYAVSAFQAVLSLNPGHAEARRYLRLSLQFYNDLIESQFRDGLVNKSTGRYELCKAAMKNIMNLVNDPTNERYREAQKVYMECDLKFTAGGL